jgi:nitroimidazol reductase NimA-like FMN-containing flavoprotein (pyridoxamine 5'-phosphate oxidase superfamily)
VRRSDREIRDDATIAEILQAAQVCRIAFCDGDRPYVVPMNFGIDGRRLYFHCAGEGRKLELLKRNPHVCFEVDVDHALVRGDYACGWGWRYRSVVGYGRLRRVEDPQEKRRGLDALMRHYGGTGALWTDAAVERVTVLCLEIAEATGKACPISESLE